MILLKNKSLIHYLLKIKCIFYKICRIAGLIFLLLIGASFTDLPYYAYHRLGTSQIDMDITQPDYIILLGAGGMPGGENLIRIHYAAKTALKYSSSKIIIALPADSADFSTSDHYEIFQTLMAAGIDTSRIISEYAGFNTYSQSKRIAEIIQTREAQLILITSPEHMYRSILTFRKTGFKHVSGIPAFENHFEESLLQSEENKANPDSKKPAENIQLRYNMWSYLQYEIKVIREYTAIAFYEFKGYI